MIRISNLLSLLIWLTIVASNDMITESSSLNSDKPQTIETNIKGANSSINSTSTFTEVVIPSLAVGLGLSGVLYVNASFGSPLQKQKMNIDTTKKYSWILSGANDIQCNKLASGCLAGNLYYPQESITSFELTNDTNKLKLEFIDQTSIQAIAYMDAINFTSVNTYNYYNSNTNSSFNKQNKNMSLNDRVTIESNYLSIENTTFLVADDDGLTTTILGLAGSNNNISSSSNAILGVSDDYDSFILLNKLKNLNLISTTSYSLWLGNITARNETAYGDDSDADSKLISQTSDELGKLIFGGIDPSLFKGPFYQFNLLSYIDATTNQSVKGYPILPMGPIYMTASNGRSINVTSEDFKQPVLLDSGDSSIYLPINSIIQVAIQLGATYVETFERWLVPCNVGELDAHIDFTFDGLRIKVPVSDLLGESFDSSGNSTIHFTDGSEACYLKIFSSDDIGYNRLGSTFLRNAYIAVDTEMEVIAIAKARKLDVETNATITVKSANYISGIVTTVTEVRSVVPITSGGTIPYATPRSYTDDNTLSIIISETSAKIPAQFTGYVYSNGIISGFGRSFYDTDRPTTTTTKKTSTLNLTVNSSGMPYANETTTASKNQAARLHNIHNLKDVANHEKVFSECFLGILFAIFAMMLPLL